MTMVRQHPPQPPPPLLSPNGPYNPPPPSPQRNLWRNPPAHDQKSLAQQVPQQWAYPLSRHNSYASQGSADNGSDRSKPPEHMLRRKTPQGVLAGAYDGASVEHTEKPHATKHIILPVTAESGIASSGNYSYGMKQDLPLRSPAIHNDIRRVTQDALSDWNPSLYFETGSGRGHDNWKSSQHALPQIDSMLNQAPVHHAPLYYPAFGSPYGGAPLQSPLGPTVSNDQGPYGPYWHDGTYIPYRPAAMRDPRFYSHHGPTWDSPWVTHNGVPSISNFQQNPFQLHQPASLPQPNMYNNQPRPSIDYSVPFQQNAHRNLSLDYQSQPIAPPFVQRHSSDFGLSSSGQSTPRPEHIPTTPLSEFGPQSSHGQMRERVFAWAHTVYIDLLKYLQSTRKSSSNNRHPNAPQQAVRPHIYPKPPRQPSTSFSNTSSSSGSYSSERPSLFSSHSWQQGHPHDPIRPLRRMSGTSIAGVHQSFRPDMPPSMTAASALDAITKHCEESEWDWIDGILLGGCLCYALGDYQKAQDWYRHILKLDPGHVEAISNLAATLLALQQKQEAEKYWRKAVKLRPSYFEAVEHLIGMLCGDHRGREAVKIIEEVERSLKFIRRTDIAKNSELSSERSASTVSQSPNVSEVSDRPVFEFEGEGETIIKDLDDLPGSDQPGFGSSGYAIPGSENGRMLALAHAKGNMLYALGDNTGAAKAFENAVLIGAGHRIHGINGLIRHILSVVAYDVADRSPGGRRLAPSADPILLHPESALKTAHLCFAPHGELPGLKYVSTEGMSRKAAVSTTSNSLLSLAKIFQDGMATNSPKTSAYQSTHGVREILALYYLSLSLQPSPSTANNVGILLASVQQAAPPKPNAVANGMPKPQIPGLVPGSGVALALAYYNYGLLLDSRHAHLYTNLGSLLKDIGQLEVAISMYEQAVACDGNFDIALANLANAVKDKGRISDAIMYYRRAVRASPDFAEAVCGLANALNSVCDWSGRGGIAEDAGTRDRWHVNEKGMLLDATLPGASSSGWIERVVGLVKKQLADGEDWGRGILDEPFIQDIVRPFLLTEGTEEEIDEKQLNLMSTLNDWQGKKWEGARMVRLVERATRMLTWQWYQDKHIRPRQRPSGSYRRPHLPLALTVPAAPTVLPFHTFTCPMSAKQIRQISQRNGLRISCSTLKAPWLPANVFAPPPPPNPHLKVGYVSSDFNNHPLAHLMQSVFGLHDPNRVKAYCYATTASDHSVHRAQIEKEAPVFYDASNWPAERLVQQILKDGIHILVNLNGYTRGAKNEVFAARPAPIQMSFMGFAGTLGAEWCDYLLADSTAVPPDTLRSWRRNVDMEDQLIDETYGGTGDSWIYGENIIFCRDTFFCCDHRQSAPDAQGRQLNWEEEQHRRWAMRKELFPHLPDDAIIFGNFNQLYKIEPTTFRTWLRILTRLPNAVLWLLRFPDLGETNLKQTAALWATPEVASRIIFTDVAQKAQHIARARVCDLFLDTPECNGHTTAADVLWSGTPLLTLPRYKYKMCSRMAASILKGALPKNEDGKKAEKDLIASSDEEYEEMAVKLGKDCRYEGYRSKGRLAEMRKILYEGRWTSALFDTRRWVRDLEESYEIAWNKWVRGEGGDIWLR